jgi:raffinose/stachyose/melibiose transport system substrate-binding protein
MSKKSLKAASLVMMLCILTSALLAACAPAPAATPAQSVKATEAPTAAPIAPAEKVKIRILTRWTGSDPTTPAFEQVKKDFMALHRNIEIVDESIADNDAFNAKLKAGMATGDLPHVFAVWNPAEYAKNGMLLDLSKYMDEDKAWSGGFVPGIVETVGKFPGLPGVYLFPMENNYEVMYYNPDVFTAAGIKEPPKTFDALLDAVGKIKAAGYTPIGAGAKEAWRVTHLFNGLWMKSLGAQRGFELGTGQTKFSDPDAVEVLRKLRKLVDSGAFDKNMGGIDYATERANFLSGKTAMMYNGTWYIADLEKSDLKDKVKVFLMPDVPGSKFNDNDILYAGGWAVSNLIKSAAEKAAAVEFAKYISGQKGSDTIVSMTKRPSTRTDNTVDVKSLGRIISEITALQKNVKRGGTDIFAYTLKPKMESIINNNVVAVVLGTKTPEEAAKILADEMTKE